jgi:hypothetical protein
MKTKFLAIIGIVIAGGGFGIAYGIHLSDSYQDQKQFEEWRDIRESILDEIREKKLNQTISENASIMTDEEQCSLYFDMAMDEFVQEQGKYDNSTGAILEPLSEDQIVSTSKQFAKWRSMGCAFSIPEWANLSNYKDWIWENIGPTFKIRGLHSRMLINEPIFITVEKIGYDMCDSWDAKIIDLTNNSTIWDKQFNSLCVTTDNQTPKKFNYTISNEINPIIISNLGDYTFQMDIGSVCLERKFEVIEHFEDIVIDEEW